MIRGKRVYPQQTDMESDTGSRKARQEVQIMNSHEQHIETCVGEQTTISDIKLHFYAHHQKEVPAKDGMFTNFYDNFRGIRKRGTV